VAADSSACSTHPPGMVGFAASLWRSFTWRTALATQSLGALFALTEWLERGNGTIRLLVYLLCAQAVTALLVLAAALAGDEAVCRGWKVLRAFSMVVLGASLLNAAGQGLLDAAFSDIAPGHGPASVANDFFNVGALWGTALLVYLNRQSAARLLAHLRADDLARAQEERRAVTSRLVAAEARMDTVSVLRRLSTVREQFATAHPGADGNLEDLIAALRASVSRTVAMDQAIPESQPRS